MEWLTLLERFCLVVGLVMGALYFYQAGYLAVGLLGRGRRETGSSVRLRRYAVLISARNEEGVIGELIESLKKQNYPRELLDIYVVADNCTDGTAWVACLAGAKVYVRHDRAQVGKGYALDYLWKKLEENGLESRYEGYFIFDADNIVAPGFVAEMNRTFDGGDFAAVTGYRNSKNFGQNWITAGYSVWFLREARFVNAARMALGISCSVSGTGFLISAQVLREKGGWPWHLLTEDIQLSAEMVAEGKKIGYCGRAVFYDEQPTSFRQSWVQRERWSKGFYQVSGQYAPALIKGALRGGRKGFGCYDMLITVTPGVLMLATGAVLAGLTALALLGVDTLAALRAVLAAVGGLLWSSVVGFYRGMFLYGLLTVVSEWREIRATTGQKLGYLVTFPLFMMTYLPISVAAMLHKVEWKPIQHTSVTRMKLDPAA